MELYHNDCGSELKPEAHDIADGAPVTYRCSGCHAEGLLVTRISNEIDGKEYAELSPLAEDSSG